MLSGGGLYGVFGAEDALEEGTGGGEDESVGGESDAVADEDDVGEVLLLEELQAGLGEGRRQRRGSGQRGAGWAEGLLNVG